jgi:hydroxymethylpyrimidine pyrophosphatase-like HAD family hydrolase
MAEKLDKVCWFDWYVVIFEGHLKEFEEYLYHKAFNEEQIGSFIDFIKKEQERFWNYENIRNKTENFVNFKNKSLEDMEFFFNAYELFFECMKWDKRWIEELHKNLMKSLGKLSVRKNDRC